MKPAAAGRCSFEYNRVNGITPESIKKNIGDVLHSVYEQDYFTVPIDTGPAGDIPLDEIPRIIKGLQKDMKEASRLLEYERAAEIRDRIKELKELELALGVKV